MDCRYQVQGNLALAMDRTAVDFTVIEGGRDSRMHDVESHSVRHYGLAVRIMVSLAIIVVLCSSFAAFTSKDAAFDRALRGTDLVEFSVEDGDSLWSIASEHPVEGLTTQEAVDAIMRWNELDAAGLHPGQTLLVPGK